MGAAAVKELLAELDINALSEQLKEELETGKRSEKGKNRQET